MEKNLLMIFIKNPVAGEVKTRLGADIGSTNALLIYQKLLGHTRSVAMNVRCDRQVWYSSMIDRRDAWSPENFDKKLQKGEDLGKRMAHAFQSAFSNGYSRVVIIGSDCADLSADHIEQAFSILEEKDAVIGPSNDGGYYLLGLSSFCSDLFTDIEWSTPEVFRKTIDVFKTNKLTFEQLESLMDIDTIDDLKKSDITLP